MRNGALWTALAAPAMGQAVWPHTFCMNLASVNAFSSFFQAARHSDIQKRHAIFSHQKAWYVNVCHTKNCFHHISSILYRISHSHHSPHSFGFPTATRLHGPRRLTWPRHSWRRCGPTWWSTRVRPARWAAPPPPTAAAAPSGGPWWREHRCWRRCGWDGEWLGMVGMFGMFGMVSFNSLWVISRWLCLVVYVIFIYKR